MDLSTWVLFGVIAVLGMNQMLMRVERLAEDDRVYFLVQFVDLAVASAIILLGLPGFEAFPAVPVVVGLLFVFHVAQNYNSRAIRLRDEREDERREIEEEAAHLRETRAPEEDF